MIFNKLRLPASSRPQRVATRPLSRRNLSRRISARYHYFPFFPFWKHSLHAFFDDFESIFRIWSIFVGMMIKPKYPLKTNISSLPWGYGKKICIWFWPTNFFKIVFIWIEISIFVWTNQYDFRWNMNNRTWSSWPFARLLFWSSLVPSKPRLKYKLSRFSKAWLLLLTHLVCLGRSRSCLLFFIAIACMGVQICKFLCSFVYLCLGWW